MSNQDKLYDQFDRAKILKEAILSFSLDAAMRYWSMVIIYFLVAACILYTQYNIAVSVAIIGAVALLINHWFDIQIVKDFKATFSESLDLTSFSVRTQYRYT